MHGSKLAGSDIDCRTGDLPAAAKFWRTAREMAVASLPKDGKTLA